MEILSQHEHSLIYNDISKRDGATADSEQLWGLMNSLPVFVTGSYSCDLLD